MLRTHWIEARPPMSRKFLGVTRVGTVVAKKQGKTVACRRRGVRDKGGEMARYRKGF